MKSGEPSWTPLHAATASGNLIVVKALLRKPALLPNQASLDGTTPLLAAILAGNIDILNALLMDERVITNHHEYRQFLETVLSNTATIKYYLSQMITHPKKMRDALIENPIFSGELAKQRHVLWNMLQNPTEVNLQPDKHCDVLKEILASRQQRDKNLHHPLYTLFEPNWSCAFFRPDQNSILNDIEAEVTTYSQRQNSVELS